jgi:hypothetical protein
MVMSPMGLGTKNHLLARTRSNLAVSKLHDSQNHETVKYGHESRGTRTQKRLYWRGQQQFTRRKLVSSESVGRQQGHEHGTRAVCIRESRYQAATSEDVEGLLCALVMAIFRMCR